MRRLRVLLVILCVLTGLASTRSARAGDTFVVSSLADSGSGSLAQAILLANSRPGPHLIQFKVLIDGPYTIRMRGPLAAITQPVVIDGTTQPGFAGFPVIELDGSVAGFNVDGLRLMSGNSAVRGLIINRFSGYGIVVNASDNVIEGNFIGTNTTGSAALGNGKGGVLVNGANNRVGGSTSGARNIISGNTGPGVSVTGSAATGNRILGNYIGINSDGTAALPNAGHGVSITSANNEVGGAAAGTRNVIAGNNGSGVYIAGGGASGNVVRGNHIGTNAAGTAPLGNGGHGVFLFGANNTVGGTVPGARNIIAGNALRGVYIAGSGASGNTVQGNYIGANAAGTAALGNGDSGVVIQDAPNNAVGGTISAARNIIAGNGGTGIYITGGGATANQIQGNYIGTNAAGRASLGNGDAGILIQDAPANIIGGTQAGARNVIAGNAGTGVYLSGGGSTANVVQDNYIGTNAAGTAPLGNGNSGIAIQDAPNNSVGGTTGGVGNLISGNEQQGIFITGSGALTNLVQGNHIGTNATGTAIIGNGDNGVLIQDAPGNVIGGTDPRAANIISGNSQQGVFITGNGATGNLVQGNFIGTNTGGTAALANGASGVAIQDAPGNVLGGAVAAARNVISGNAQHGVFIIGAWASDNRVLGNVIGANAAANSPVPNGGSGVVVQDAANNRVGGGAAEARNIISGNAGQGVLLAGSGTTGNLIQGNYIGTSLDGHSALANGDNGVLVQDSSANSLSSNLLSGNTTFGIRITSSAIGNMVHANLIGTDAPGGEALPNGQGGISISGQNTQVGGAANEQRNVISGNGGPGITLLAGAAGAQIKGNTIGMDRSRTAPLGNATHGIVMIGSARNIVGGPTPGEGNIIAYSGGAGIRIDGATSVQNGILGNLIFGNTGLGISLGGRIMANDAGDRDIGPNGLQNSPAILNVTPGVDGTQVTARLDSAPFTTYRVEFFAGDTCQSAPYGQAQTFIGSTNVRTDINGSSIYSATVSSALSVGRIVTATATDPTDNTSPFSTCTVVTGSNDSWPRAKYIPLTASASDPATTEASVTDYIDKAGQTRWYKFSVTPGSRLTVGLKDLPANYDLVLYKDIATAYKTLTSPQDLVRLSAEFDDGALLPESAAHLLLTSTGVAPDSYAPDSFAPDSFAGYAYAPDSFAPDSFAPDSFAPDSFAPDSFAPDSFAPDSFAYDPSAFSSAQQRSIVAVSAMNGRADEQITVRTWENTGDYYVRVRGHDGASNANKSFTLNIVQVAGVCATVMPVQVPSTHTPTAGNYKTIILTDLARMPGTSAEKATLQQRLTELAGRPEVAGVIVDVGSDDRALAARLQADTAPDCPTAQNILALTIKELIDRYRAPTGDGQWLNPLEYVVIVGGDSVIPFFRHPDRSPLANETAFVPPVLDGTPSQASLRLGYLLSQDRYGEASAITLNGAPFPIPSLAVGRLVETAAEATTMLDAYLSTSSGVVRPATPALVTGYDFLEDAARAVKTELEAGLQRPANTLIQPRGDTPSDPTAWTASDLRTKLLSSRHDLIFLAGHFSAGSALAADYKTRLLASEVANSNVDLVNTVIFSAGCHSGYATVNADAVPGVTLDPDWPSAFARKGAVLIAGTGYQYGDTDVLEYGERLYLEFARRLRMGNEAVPVGKALVAAKQHYLASTPSMRPLHSKTVLQATLYGLPMLAVNMPGERLPIPTDTSIVTAVRPYTVNPGLTLGLTRADLTITPTLTSAAVPFRNVQTGETIVTTYLSGLNGIYVNPGDLVLPLESRNVTVADTVLRGVGFRGGTSTEQADVLPLTSAVAVELSPIRNPFRSDQFYPVQPWTINQFDALGAGGATRLVVTPAQFKNASSASATGTLRRFNTMNFRLFYSNNINSYAGNVPALAAPPSISRVTGITAGQTVTFTISVAGSPVAGVQEVWVTYLNTAAPFPQQWRSLDLTQDPRNSTVWQGTLALGNVNPANLRYIVQAVNGVGLVTLATNMGALYTPIPDPNAGRDADSPPPPLPETSLTLDSLPTSAAYGSQLIVSAILRNGNATLPNQPVSFSIGAQRRDAITDANGRAQVTLLLLDRPGDSLIRASFAGGVTYASSSASSPLVITKQPTRLSIMATPAGANGTSTGAVATLFDARDNPISQKTILFVVRGNSLTDYVTLTTDYTGRAVFDPLPVWARTVTAYFATGEVEVGPGQTVRLSDDVFQGATFTFRPGRSPYEMYLPLIVQNQNPPVPQPTTTPMPQPTSTPTATATSVSSTPTATVTATLPASTATATATPTEPAATSTPTGPAATPTATPASP